MPWIWLLHVATTGTMFGVIWVIQIVHYPLFADVGAERFVGYEARHQNRITWIVFPAMVVELTTACLLVMAPPEVLPLPLLWAGLALVGVVWLSTAFLQVPLHKRLSDGFEPATHRWLCWTNWIRTAAWSLRFGLVLWLTGRWLAA